MVIQAVWFDIKKGGLSQSILYVEFVQAFGMVNSLQGTSSTYQKDAALNK